MVFIRPDGFAGALMAAEGFKDVCTLLHGPGGCRFRYMRLSRELYSRPTDSAEDSLDPYFNGNPRIPCTFLDEKDYIYGGVDKVKEALERIASRGCPLIVVIDSPATALIGDNVRKAIDDLGLSDRAFTIDFNPVSQTLSQGTDSVTTEIVKFIGPVPRTKMKDTVNLIGIPLLCRDWEGTVEEVTSLLDMMGLKVHTAIGAGSSVEEVRRSADAEYNICVYPDCCEKLGRYYEDTFGIPCNRMDYAPIGFDATEEWIRSVAEMTGHDPSVALEHLCSTRKRVRSVLLSDERRARRVTGAHFAIECEGSTAVPLCRWLHRYLSMIPVAVDGIGPDPLKEELEKYAEENGLGDIVGKPATEGDYLFSSGDYSAMWELSGKFGKGVDIGFPPRREFLFNNKTVVGVRGTLNILDSIFNVQ
ncbi:MAG: nitrogenase component 1 [archaeon]|nr:nitrogenase component 1 [archaeon]